MSNRFSVHPQRLARSLRFVLAGTALLASTVIQTLPASADVDLAARSARSALLSVDSPTANALVSNGAMVDIGGWTAGTRFDAYLDGPAGEGFGIGSAAVIGARPDVAGLFGADLAYSGFDVAWRPMDLTDGEHTLYFYSLIDGSWTFQTRSIIAEG